MEPNVYSLFDNRHTLPDNSGSLFSDFDFKTFKGVKTELYYEALKKLQNGETIYIYVTGLTPAITEFLFDAIRIVDKPKIVLLHYNKEINEYIPQGLNVEVVKWVNWVN